MPNTHHLAILNIDDIEKILPLTEQLNPDKSLDIIRTYQKQMFGFENYRCFGLFDDDILVGVCSGWITVRLYCGKQLELDNFVVESTQRSKGIGAIFTRMIEDWAIAQGFDTIELNAYTNNSRGAKFYLNQGFHILGFHFQKSLC